MTDRELLELAAKAAGIDGSCARSAALRCVDKSGAISYWSPLTDDGDALRLAVKIGLFSDSKGMANFQAFYSDEIRRANHPTEATRRAITTIAAMLGRAML